MPPVPPADLSVGAFSSTPPWIVDPEDLRWRYGSDELRASTASQVPALLRRRRIPPGGRVVRVSFELGRAVAGWYLLDRRRARRSERPEISPRRAVAPPQARVPEARTHLHQTRPDPVFG